MVEVILIVIGLLLISSLVMMVSMFMGQLAPDATSWFMAAGTRIMTIGLKGLALVAGVLATIWITGRVNKVLKRTSARRRDAAQEERERRARNSDPVLLAERDAPDLVEKVQGAVHSIEMLRAVAPSVSTQQSADALALVDERLPSLLGRHASAFAGTNDEERSAMGQRALLGVIDIGRIAEEARVAVVHAIGDEIDTETRYISSRVSDDRLSAG